MERYIVEKKVKGRFCYHASFPEKKDALLVARLITDAETRVFDRQLRMIIETKEETNHDNK